MTKRIALALVFAFGCRTTAGAIATTFGLASAIGGNALLFTNDSKDAQIAGYSAIVAGSIALLYALASESASAEPIGSGLGGGGSAGLRVASPSTITTASGNARRDPDGHYYDASGAPSGRVDADGHYYDASGAPAGRRDDAAYYTGSGAPAGRIDSDGHVYDATGAPAGRIDSDGHIYDATGTPAGQLNRDCDDACKRELAGRLLLAK